jgi:hypothetical protein
VACANYFADSPYGDDGEADANHGVLTLPGNVQLVEEAPPPPPAVEEAAAVVQTAETLVVKIPSDDTKKVGLQIAQAKHGLYIKKVTPGGRGASVVGNDGVPLIKVGCRLVKVSVWLPSHVKM